MFFPHFRYPVLFQIKHDEIMWILQEPEVCTKHAPGAPEIALTLPKRVKEWWLRVSKSAALPPSYTIIRFSFYFYGLTSFSLSRSTRIADRVLTS